MARVRNLKPGFFTNEDLAECSCWARLCFAGLWTIADREGRLEDRPKRIKGQLFPMDTVDVDPLLDELQARGFILRYAHQSRGFIQIIAFHKHQNPHFREPSSVIPSPESLGLAVDAAAVKPGAFGSYDDQEAQGKPGAFNGLKEGQASDKPGALSSKVDIECTQSRAEPGTRNPENGERPLEQRAARKTAERFEEFWAEYPVKKGRADAEAKWRAKGYDTIADRIIADVKRRKAEDRQWLDGYAPHGSTYVNGRGWEDAIEPARGAAGGGVDVPDYLVGAL